MSNKDLHHNSPASKSNSIRYLEVVLFCETMENIRSQAAELCSRTKIRSAKSHNSLYIGLPSLRVCAFTLDKNPYILIFKLLLTCIQSPLLLCHI